MNERFFPSYNLGDMAQKSLPGNRKLLDYGGSVLGTQSLKGIRTIRFLFFLE